jgi:hypothetical protein
VEGGEVIWQHTCEVRTPIRPMVVVVALSQRTSRTIPRLKWPHGKKESKCHLEEMGGATDISTDISVVRIAIIIPYHSHSHSHMLELRAPMELAEPEGCRTPLLPLPAVEYTLCLRGSANQVLAISQRLCRSHRHYDPLPPLPLSHLLSLIGAVAGAEADRRQGCTRTAAV